jgi:hypothetical protein
VKKHGADEQLWQGLHNSRAKGQGTAPVACSAGVLERTRCSAMARGPARRGACPPSPALGLTVGRALEIFLFRVP